MHDGLFDLLLSEILMFWCHYFFLLLLYQRLSSFELSWNYISRRAGRIKLSLWSSFILYFLSSHLTSSISPFGYVLLHLLWNLYVQSIFVKWCSKIFNVMILKEYYTFWSCIWHFIFSVDMNFEFKFYFLFKHLRKFVPSFLVFLSL